MALDCMSYVLTDKDGLFGSMHEQDKYRGTVCSILTELLRRFRSMPSEQTVRELLDAAVPADSQTTTVIPDDQLADILTYTTNMRKSLAVQLIGRNRQRVRSGSAPVDFAYVAGEGNLYTSFGDFIKGEAFEADFEDFIQKNPGTYSSGPERYLKSIQEDCDKWPDNDVVFIEHDNKDYNILFW